MVYAEKKRSVSVFVSCAYKVYVNSCHIDLLFFIIYRYSKPQNLLY